MGDALDVVVDRLGARRTLERPLVTCASCGAPASRAASLPLVRTAWRSGVCTSCGKPFDRRLRRLLLAATCAAVLAGLAARIGADVALLPYDVLGLSLVTVSFIDLERFLIPNRVIYPTVALVLPLFVVASEVDDRWASLGRGAIAGAVAFAAFFLLHLAVPKGMGYGDVRLAGLVGGGVGWLGFGRAFVAFLAAFVLGSIIGLVVMSVTGGGRKTRIPFGPFLAAGAVISLLWGGPIANALFHRGG